MADSKGNTLWHQVYEPFGIAHLSITKRCQAIFIALLQKNAWHHSFSYLSTSIYSSANNYCQNNYSVNSVHKDINEY